MALKGEFRGSSRKKSAASAAFGKENNAATLTGAVQNGDIRELRRLLKRGANKEETNDRGETALILAAQLGDMEAIRLLADCGADINAKSSTNLTALMASAQNGDLEALKFLISKGADIEAKKKDETTVLMIAAMFGQMECIEELIFMGVNIFAEDIYGYTALDLAAGSEDCIEVLTAAEEKALTEGHGPENQQQNGTLKKALASAGKKSKRVPRAAKPEKVPVPVQNSTSTKPPA